MGKKGNSIYIYIDKQRINTLHKQHIKTRHKATTTTEQIKTIF